MGEMVEKVAKAIFDAMDIADGLDGTVAEKYARAAIEAMREPTVDMVAVAFPCEKDEKFSLEDRQLGAAACLKLGGWDKIGIMAGEPIKQAAFLVRDYRLMIDAALSDASAPALPDDR